MNIHRIIIGISIIGILIEIMIGIYNCKRPRGKLQYLKSVTCPTRPTCLGRKLNRFWPLALLPPMKKQKIFCLPKRKKKQQFQLRAIILRIRRLLVEKCVCVYISYITMNNQNHTYIFCICIATHTHIFYCHVLKIGGLDPSLSEEAPERDSIWQT